MFEINAKGTKELLLDQVKETLQVLGLCHELKEEGPARGDRGAVGDRFGGRPSGQGQRADHPGCGREDQEGHRGLCREGQGLQEGSQTGTFKFDNGWDASYSELDGAVNEIESLNEELYKFKRLADLFEFPEVIAPIAETIDNCQADLGVLRSVWTTTQKCETQFSEWRKTTWTEIKTDVMEMGTKGFIKEIKALPQRARAYDVYSGIERSAKNFLICIPLVADLSSPDMRDRHWQQLMETGVKLVIDANFKLDDTALELHKYETTSTRSWTGPEGSQDEKSLSILKET